MPRILLTIGIVGLLAGELVQSLVCAQTRIQLPSSAQPLSPGQSIGGGVAPAVPPPALPSNTAPGVPRTFTPPPSSAPATGPLGSGTSLGAPTFDPYSTQNAASTPPSLFGSPSSAPRSGPYGGALGGTSQPLTPGWGAGTAAPTIPYNSATPTPGWPIPNDPYAAAPSAITPYGSSPYGGSTVPPYPSTGYPGGYQAEPSVLFPGGVFPGWSPPQVNWPQPQEGRYLRLFQDIRLKHTWLMGGDSSTEMGINDTELATTVNFPNFFWSGQPLQVSPGFIAHWWDGPVTKMAPPDAFPTELPARVYSAYLTFGWDPRITPQLGADLDVTVGVFDDFEGFTADSVRLLGTGLLVLAVTPTVTMKLGVTYLDRVDLKLLPAVGIVWTPNPQTRWDIYFPRPKLSRYLTTIGNTDVWGFVAAEYGGGSWTVRREGVDDRRVDINDIRVGGGFEWTNPLGLQAFVEAAYVFERQLVFASGPIAEHDLEGTIMVRGGLAY